MLDLFNEINSLQGVKGTFAKVGDQGIISGDLPADFTPVLLDQFDCFLGDHLKRNMASACQILEMELRFAESTVLCHNVGPQAVLVILADPSINLGLLAVTLDLLQEELQEAATNIQEDPKSLIKGGQKPTLPPPEPDKLIKGALEEPLNIIAQILSDTIGPISKIIVSDSIKSWIQVGEASGSRLNELIDILCMEIGDSVLEARFRQEIKPILMKSYKQDAAANPAQSGSTKIMVSASLSKTLTQLLELFTEFMGPVGATIMKGCLRRWTEAHPPSVERLDELIEMLATNISRTEHKKKFRQQADSLP